MPQLNWPTWALLILFSISTIVGVGRSIQSAADKPSLSVSSGVAVIYIYGPISTENQNGFGPDTGTDSLISQLYEIEKDSRIKAVVLRINSPGGTAGSAQELYTELQKFRKRTKLPVVVSIADLGASGAVWVMMASDYIFANSTSLVGSIGVIISTPDFSKIADKYGVGMTTYKSVKYKDMLSSWRKPTTDEQAMIQSLLADTQSEFIKAVATGRNMSVKRVAQFADGRILTGTQAKQIGLIDALGTYHDALAYAAQKAGLKGTPKIIYRSRHSVLDWLKTLNDDTLFQKQLRGMMGWQVRA